MSSTTPATPKTSSVLIDEAAEDAKRNHCEAFKKYYIAAFALFLLAIITARAAPKELREGNRGCSGGCGSDTSDCCIGENTGYPCYDRCFCSRRDSSPFSDNSWYCRDREPTMSGGATAVFCLFFFASFFVCICLCVSVQHRREIQLVDNPQGDAFVVATAKKSSVDAKLGIRLAKEDGELYVSLIQPESPFKNSLLREGMEILQINDKLVTSFEPSEAIKMLKEAKGKVKIQARVTLGTHERRIHITGNEGKRTETDGEDHDPESVTNGAATFVSDTIIATVQRDDPEQKLGIALMRIGDGSFFISKLTPESPFQNTSLQVGMKATLINNVEVTGKEMRDTMAILKSTEKQVTIVAETVEDPPFKMSGSEASESSPSQTGQAHDALVGNDDDRDKSHTNVDSVAEEAPAASVATSTGASGTNASASSGIEVFVGDEGYHTPRATITAIAHKATVDQKLGMTLSRTSDGIIKISKLRSDSQFVILGLSVGLRVISINGVELTGQDMSVATMLMKEAIGDVQITAEESS